MMAQQIITARPTFEPPLYFKKSARWSQRRIPDGYSDGEQKHWPPCPPYRPSSEEFYLCILGQQWAELDRIALPGVQYYIDRLPDGYAMFEQDQPGGTQVYKRLFGHPSGRFYDSAARFAPHFLWLMSGKDGDCDCIYCTKKSSKPIVPRQTRAPREVIEKSITSIRQHPRDLTDNDNENDSSRASSTGATMASRRTQRQARHGAASVAVDEEGTEDIYKDCVKKLENAMGSTRGVEIDLSEEGSIDWKADRESLPQYLTQIEQQHCFIPRIGELVLWCPEFLDGHYLMIDPKTQEHKFYSFEQKCFHGFPAWRGGLVTAGPSASVKNGPIDFQDILDAPKKKTALNTSGFRIETMPDPNDDMNKAMSKQYRYVPLRHIRPLSHWQMLLKGIPQAKLHTSIQHALTCMTSLSLLEKWRFNGDWPGARIFCKGIYLGSELITVGDTIRLLPRSTSELPQPDVLIVDSIRYNLLDMKEDHTRADNPGLCGRSYVAFVGSAYTSDLNKLKVARLSDTTHHELPRPLATAECKTIFRSVGAEEYGPWYPWHGPRQRYEVSYDLATGRLYEADAVRLWTGQRQMNSSAQPQSRPSLTFDIKSILAGRRYATQTDARLPEPETPTVINWFLADTRAEALAVATVNGIDVGKFHEARTPPTLKQWHMQVRVADGQQVASEVVDEYIRDLSLIQTYSGKKRGRPTGSRVIDGKLVTQGHKKAGNKYEDTEDIDQHKPSSQMAGAALFTDSDGSSEDGYSDELGEEVTASKVRPTIRKPQATAPARSALSKADIMASVEGPGNDVLDDDVSDDGAWWDEEPPPLRGGTEESEGGDYHE